MNAFLAVVLAAQSAAPVVRTIEIVGASAYDRDRVLRVVRLETGAALVRDADAIAAALESRYRDDGYAAARVTGRFDPETGTLTLAVDEGRLASVGVEGLEGKAEARALRELGLSPGKVLKEHELSVGFERLGVASEGVLAPSGDPPYSIEPSPQGARLLLHLDRSFASAKIRPEGPGHAALFERVDGLAPWLGGELRIHDLSSYDHAVLYARGSYGLSSDDARFVLGARRPFGGGRVIIGYELHDLTDTDDAFRASGLEETVGSALFRSSFRDYFRRRGHEAYVGARGARGAQMSLAWRSDSYGSLPVASDWSLFRPDRTPRTNPAVEEGEMRSLVATAGWGAGRSPLPVRDLYGTGEAQDGVCVHASLEVASADALGGDFTFTRFIGRLSARKPLAGGHSLAARALVGLSGGTAPAQKRFALGGLGTLRGYHYKELTGENMALATLEWGFDLPTRLPRLVLFYDGGAAWTEGTDSGGFRSDAGAGLEWAGAGRVLIRLDVALPLDRGPGRDRVRPTMRLRAPF